jgi:hypothetical protein
MNVDQQGLTFCLFILVSAKMGGSTYWEEAAEFVNTHVGFIAYMNKQPNLILDN